MKHSKGAPVFTEADIRAHAQRTGVGLPKELIGTPVPKGATVMGEPFIVTKPRQNKTEQSFGLILEAQKRRGGIVEYRPFGIRLEWGANPETGKPMIYTPDFYVVVDELHHETNLQRVTLPIRIIETKGPFIWPKDKTRFRGCRAEWPMFDFQMWQKKGTEWNRIE